MVTVPRSSRMGCSCAVHAALTRGTGAHRAGADPSPTHSRCTYPGGRRRQPPSSDLSCAVFFRSCPAGRGRTGSAAKRIVAAESRAKKKKKPKTHLAQEAVRVASELPGAGRWDRLLCKGRSCHRPWPGHRLGARADCHWPWKQRQLLPDDSLSLCFWRLSILYIHI